MIGRTSRGSALSSRMDEREMTEIRDAVTALLRRPLLTFEAAPVEFPKVRRHQTRLKEWFAEELGYRLVVDSEFARLMKVPPPVTGASRVLATPSGAPFTSLHYSLLCLVLAVLEKSGDQTTLEAIAEDLQLRAAEIEGLFLDFDRAAHRRAFVQAVRALVDLTVLRLLDGDEERFARGEKGGNALYRVEHRRRTCLLSCGTSPSSAECPADLTREEVPPTAEGATRRHRHRIMRMLVEEPVLYLEDLSEDEQRYLRMQRSRMADRLERVCGLEVEIRMEGIVTVDASGCAGSGSFPAPGTVSHAALLLAKALCDRARRAGKPAREAAGTSKRDAECTPMSDTEAAVAIAELAKEYGKWWRADAREEGGAARLAAEALELLASFRLVARREGGVVPLPAIARFVPTPCEAGWKKEEDR